eukprot:813692-Pleurochrysis_carterae.AAC.1
MSGLLRVRMPTCARAAFKKLLVRGSAGGVHMRGLTPAFARTEPFVWPWWHAWWHAWWYAWWWPWQWPWGWWL